MIENAYNDTNQLIERRLLDVNMAAANNDAGWAIERYEYDEYGLRSATLRFDEDGRAVLVD